MQRSGLNGTRERVLLAMIVGTFGVGFAAGVTTTQLSDGAADVAAGDPPDAALVEPGLGPEEGHAVPLALTPGSWLGDRIALTALPAAAPPAPDAPPADAPPAAALPAQAPPPPLLRPVAAQRSAAGTLSALSRPAQIALLPPSGARSGDLASEAEIIEQARLDRGLMVDRSIEQIVVRRGDTLMDILLRARIERGEAYAALQSLRGVYDPRQLRAGQELTLTAAQRAGDDRQRDLLGLAFDLSFDHQIRVTRDAEGRYGAAKLERPQHREIVRRTAVIDDSLYLAAARIELPQDVTYNLIKMFSWDVDFQRDLRSGDGFETMFEEVSLEDGSGGVRGGDVLYAGLTLSGEIIDAYRFEVEDGEIEYYDRSGRSLRKFLMRTPVDGARLSSGFGMRHHPILGYSRMHKGVDFAAPSGTPIYAAGGGRLVSAGRNGGYGNYIRIRHSADYSTAYAHMSRLAKGMRVGSRVRQGEVIGYVGTTGRSTGPHLHYEVLRNDAQINPLSIKQPPNSQLAGADLARFRAEIERIDQLRAELAEKDTQVASRSSQEHAAN